MHWPSFLVSELKTTVNKLLIDSFSEILSGIELWFDFKQKCCDGIAKKTFSEFGNEKSKTWKHKINRLFLYLKFIHTFHCS